MNLNDLAMSNFLISDQEFRDAMDCADALQQFAAKFPEQWTSLAIRPDRQQVYAELIRAGAISLREQQSK